MRLLLAAIALAAGLAAQSVQLPGGGAPSQSLFVQLSQLARSGAAIGQCAVWNGSHWAPATCASGGNVGGAASSTAGWVVVWADASGAQLAAGLPVSPTPAANAIVEATSGGNIDPGWLPLITPSKLSQGGATTGECLIWSGSQWAPAACVTGAAGTISGPGSTTIGRLPQWGSTDGTQLGGGLAVSATPAANTVVEAGAGGTIATGWLPALAWSFNGRTGAVAPASGDYSFAQLSGSATLSQLAQSAATNGQVASWNGSQWVPVTPSAAGVTTFNGRGGAVAPASSDYSFSQLSGSATLSQLAQGAAATGQCLIWNGSQWAPAACLTGAAGTVNGPGSTTIGRLPQWGSTDGTQLGGGLAVSATPAANTVVEATGGGTIAAGWLPALAWSFNGRTGAVAPANGDYSFAQLSGSATLAQLAQSGASGGQVPAWNGAQWVPTTVSTGGGTPSSWSDLTVTYTDLTHLLIGQDCSIATPCNVRFGSVVHTMIASYTVTLSAGTGNALVYVSSSGGITVGHNLTLSCSGLCTAVDSVTAFPPDSLPLANWHATSGQWDQTSNVDVRAMLATKNVTAGAGIQTVESPSGSTQISVDCSMVACAGASGGQTMYPTITPPVAAHWTTFGAATYNGVRTDTTGPTGALVVVSQKPASNTDNIYGAYYSVAAGDFSILVGVITQVPQNNNGGDGTPKAVVGFTDTTAHAEYCGAAAKTANAPGAPFLSAWSSPIAGGVSSVAVASIMNPPTIAWFQLSRTGTALKCDYLSEGIAALGATLLNDATPSFTTSAIFIGTQTGWSTTTAPIKIALASCSTGAGGC